MVRSRRWCAFESGVASNNHPATQVPHSLHHTEIAEGIWEIQNLALGELGALCGSMPFSENRVTSSGSRRRLSPRSPRPPREILTASFR